MSQTNILLESGTNELEIVEFYIDEIDAESGETYRGYYGVNVAKVLEIIREPQVTAFPSTPHPSVRGTFNLRSRVIPLIDLAQWLGKDKAPQAECKVVVSEFNNVTNAFLVTGVTRIHRLSWEQVEAPDKNLAKFCRDCITGVVRLQDHIVLILDMESIIGSLNPSLTFTASHKIEAERPKSKDHFRAVIADDSTSIRHLIGRTLEQAGFEVARTINGKAAWDKLQEIKDRSIREERPIWDYVDVVVTDIEMPVMDGHNLTRQIKEDPVLKQLPVILFSSLITERLRHKGEAVGADDQVSKPDIATLTDKAFALIHRFQGVE